MALSFIGKPISLISHSGVRYRGILAGIDPAASTIQLSNVYSMGTEQRCPPEKFIPPVPDPYAYIIFRAAEVQDLSVDEPAQSRRNVHDDPAVLGASAPMLPPNGYPQYPQPPPAVAPPTPAQPPVSAAPQPPRPPRTTSVHSATASLEKVERALGDLRGRRRRGPDVRVPAADFDFQRANAKFDKDGPRKQERAREQSGANGNGNADGSGDSSADAAAEEEPRAYDPKRSFFDSLTSERGRGGGGGGGAGRRGGRNRREEERERNVATFGEPGGVGLMGPGAYVGGWGGYGRRGGRGRRGGGAGAGPTGSR